MDRLGCTIDDFELIEINEAFASQVIACGRDSSSIVSDST